MIVLDTHAAIWLADDNELLGRISRAMALAAHDELAAAQQHDVGVLVMCAVRRAIAAPEKLHALVAELKANGEIPADALPDTGPFDWLVRDGVASVAAAAYKFAADHPAVSCVLTGTATREHLEENVRAILGPPLPPAHRRRLVETFLPVGRNLGN